MIYTELPCLILLNKFKTCCLFNRILIDKKQTSRSWAAYDKTMIFECKTSCFSIGGPETRVFILVALARVVASHWFNIMTLYYII